MLIMLLGCAIVFGGVFGMQAAGRKGMQAHFDNMPIPPQTISTTKAELMIWPNEIHTIGSFTARNGTMLSAEVEGVVGAIHFHSGAQVSQGDKLLSLESSAQRADLQRLEAQAQLARLNLGRLRDLYRQNVVSKSAIDTAAAESAVAQAAAQAQRIDLAKREILAPFAGVLGIRQVNQGQYLSKGTAIVSLQSLDPIEIEFALAEKRLATVRPGLPVSLSVDAYPDEVFHGTVSAIEASVEASTRLFHLRASVPNPAEKLRSGMFARITIELPQAQEVIAVPRTAIKYDPYGESVFVVKTADAKDTPPDAQPRLVARHRFVRSGIARGDFLQIIEGLEPGEEIVTSGLLKLRNGQPLIINNAVTPAAQLGPPQSDS